PPTPPPPPPPPGGRGRATASAPGTPGTPAPRPAEPHRHTEPAPRHAASPHRHAAPENHRPAEPRHHTPAHHAPAHHRPLPDARSATPPAYRAAPPETAPETTVRLRPVPEAPRTGRLTAAVACLVLGVGLIGGAAVGAGLLRDPDGTPRRTAYTEAGTIWHSTPVDTLFPRTLAGDGAGPGGADRVWTRVAVAPDASCAAVLQPRLAATLAPAGCRRVLRATYTDATSSSVTTVGLVFLDTAPADMAALRTRFTTGGLGGSPDLMPPALAAPGTVAARFGNAQRGSWHVNVLTEMPVVVYGVSGFADGRAVLHPQPAAQAMAKGQTTAPAQAGLGHEARGVADRIEKGLRTTVTRAVEGPERKGNR
ncbi:hypothetical protein ACFV08_15460, partial [Streptomyces fradiae]|uniref:hypothetical protein n=1 Tax=Streptomyces fradiae TaxID=1906 RepID=UPI0036AEDBA7